MKKTLISFGNNPYHKAQERLKNSALSYFDEIISYQENDIGSKFLKKHEKIFSFKRGFGFWLWKPYFILKTLNKLNEGDFCFYADASSYFIKSPEKLFDECNKRNGILLFENELHTRTNGIWTKRDSFVLMGMDEQKYYDSFQCSAGYQVYRKNKKSMSFIKEFLETCCNYDIISDSPSIQKDELPDYKEHRHDQSILSLLAAKKGISLYRDPSQWGNYRDSKESRQVLANYRDALQLNSSNKLVKNIISSKGDDFINQFVTNNEILDSKPIKFWVSDTHVFTTQSIKYQLSPLNIEFQDYCLSGAWRFFYYRDPSIGLEAINRKNLFVPYTYTHFENLSEGFKAKYYEWAQKNVDFFWCSFSTSMAHIVSSCDKPIILQLSFRYEGYIYTKKKEKIRLQNKLLSLKEKGQLTIIASNEYDRQYFKYFTGQDIDKIPLCGDYIKPRYKPKNNTILIGTGRHYRSGYGINNQVKNALNKQSTFSIKTIKEYSGNYFKYEDLCECKAIIVIPYTVYTGAIVEYLSMGIPMFFPSPRLMAHWHVTYFNLVERNNIPYPTQNSSISGIDDKIPDPNNDIDFHSVYHWMKYCEWYNWPIETFDSLEELEIKISQADFNRMHHDLITFGKKQDVEAKNKWQDIINQNISVNI